MERKKMRDAHKKPPAVATVLRREGHGVAYRNDEQEWCR